MTEIQLISYLLLQFRVRLAAIREEPDRGDVAEKIVLVGIFVALAIAVGVIITKAVTANANHLSTQIQGAP
ncbi:MAG TPA: hypothetical protein VGS21_05005 [Acidimicrobiales bacterium]|nr:hypothetical protein [Acidimicrobiales bacterium]